MADVNISKFRASVVRDGSKPASPGFVVSEGQSPTDPAGSGQNHLPVTIAASATGLAITESQILSGAGTVGQYIRGDGSLADFPSASGGGSSISYYLNGSVNQGTIGGVAYKELSKVPILGAGTDFTINANGYIASFITDAGDPNLLEIPGGNWNFETYFSASSSGGTPTFYVELYKYDGSTFTLIASNSGAPEFIAFGTTLTAYFSTLAVPTTTLALTDRLAIRYYVTHSGRTITMHTENNHLCQVITTFTTGLTALNGLTAQVQNFAVGTSGSDFNIASATATHTFNLPTASGTNRGALSSADWSTFNSKQNALTLTTTGTSGAATLVGSTLNIPNYSPDLSGYVPTSRTITINGTTQDLSANRTFNVGTVTSVGLSSATSGVTIGSTPVTSSGTITLAIATASGSQNGLLSSTDWTTFNNKQNALTNPVTGTGTTNYLAKFTGSTTVGNSQVFDNGTNVGIGTASPTEKLDVIGVFRNLMPSDPLSGMITAKFLSYSPNPYGIHFRGYDTGLHTIQTQREGNNLALFALGLQPLGGNVLIGTTSDNGAKLQVSGQGYFGSTNYSNVIVDGTNSTGWGNNIAFKSQGTDFGYLGSIGSLLGTTTKDMTIWATSGNGFRVYTNGNNKQLEITTTGAATFSSSVTAARFISSTSSSYTNDFLNLNIGTVGQSIGLRFGYDGSSYNKGAIYFVSRDSAGRGNMQFALDPSASSSNVSTSNAIMTLNYEGNVGIGTTSPGTLLHVNGYSAANWISTQSNTGTSGHTMYFGYNNGSSTTYGLYITGGRGLANQLDFAVENKFYVNGNGNVLIGTTSDGGQRLQVSGSIYLLTGGNRNIRIGSATNYYYDLQSTNDDFQIIEAGSTPRLTIKYPNGNVGIGNASPNTKLEVASGSSGSTEVQRWSYNDGNPNFSLRLRQDVSSGLVKHVFDVVNNSTTYSNNLVLTNGNVGIGTSSPSTKLETYSLHTSDVIPTTGLGGSTTNAFITQSYGLLIGTTYTTGTVWLQSKYTGLSGTLPMSLQPLGGNVMIGTTTDNGAKLNVNGTIRTANPTGSTSDGWLLGRALVSGTSTPDRWIRVQIGNLYYDILAVYMGSV